MNEAPFLKKVIFNQQFELKGSKAFEEKII